MGWPAASSAEGYRSSPCDAPSLRSAPALSITPSARTRRPRATASISLDFQAKLWPQHSQQASASKPVIQGGWQARLALASGQGLSLRQPSSNLGFTKSASQNPCVPGNSSIRSALRTNHCPDPASQGGGRGAPSQPMWTKAGSLESKKCALFISISSTGTHTMYKQVCSTSAVLKLHGGGQLEGKKRLKRLFKGVIMKKR